MAFRVERNSQNQNKLSNTEGLRDTRTEFLNFHIDCHNFMIFLLCILNLENRDRTMFQLVY